MSYPTITIGQILEVLPKEAQDAVWAILKHKDYMDKITELKELLRQHEKALVAIGMIPDYAAYAMVYARMRTAEETT